MKNRITSVWLVIMSLVFGGVVAGQPTGRPAADMAGIAKFHRQDVQATMSHNYDALLALWADDAVLMQPGHSPLVGKAAIAASMKEAFTKGPAIQVLSYVPHFDDVQISGDVAYEWGTFSATQREKGHAPVTVSAHGLRVLRKQSDGSWKAVRAMWAFDEPLAPK